MFAQFYIAYNDGIFSGISVEFMEGLATFLTILLILATIPLLISIEDKKKKSIVKYLIFLIPLWIVTGYIGESVPDNKTVRIVSCKDSNKYILVKNLDIAKKFVKIANDDNLKNEVEVQSIVEDLFNLEKE